jgi:hypothetical protein
VRQPSVARAEIEHPNGTAPHRREGAAAQVHVALPPEPPFRRMRVACRDARQHPAVLG